LKVIKAIVINKTTASDRVSRSTLMAYNAQCRASGDWQGWGYWLYSAQASQSIDSLLSYVGQELSVKHDAKGLVRAWNSMWCLLECNSTW